MGYLNKRLTLFIASVKTSTLKYLSVSTGFTEMHFLMLLCIPFYISELCVLPPCSSEKEHQQKKQRDSFTWLLENML